MCVADGDARIEASFGNIGAYSDLLRFDISLSLSSRVEHAYECAPSVTPVVEVVQYSARI